MTKKEKIKITKSTKLTELFKFNPQVKALFLKYDMDCLHCMGIKQETIRHAAENHGIDLNTLMNEINKLIDSDKGE